MNLMPRKLSDWFHQFFQAKAFHQGIEFARQTKPHRESDDELERELAAAFAATLRQTTQLGKAMLTPMTAEERAEVLSLPLSDSGGSLKSYPPAANPAALTAPETNGTPPQPVRKGPGRPTGSKDKAPRRKAKKLPAGQTDAAEPAAKSDES
jgi:hypothetical protein